MTSSSHDVLIDRLDRWRPRRMIVVGDYMLDHYVYGHADRLSPDAPVPVLAVQSEQSMPGGASNVCRDLVALGCKVTCVGVVGQDAQGQQLKRALDDAGCQTQGLIAVSDRPTTVKANYVGLAQHRHPQKMFRLDYERKAPIASAAARRLLTQVKKQLPRADAVIIEDYNKGVLTDELVRAINQAAKTRGVPVFVDPAAISDYRKYAGATCITPNRTEAQNATGMVGDRPDELVAMGRALLRTLQLESVVLTLDKQGALLLQRGRKPQWLPTRARAVYDVTGAGDMVIAMLAAARANDASWPEAVGLANIAAGIEVEKFGVVPIELSEILLALLQERGRNLGKLRTLEQLLPEIDAYRTQGRRIVFTNGCFDILHAGHVSYLRDTRRRGDLLIVGLNSDASIKRIKGKGRPVNQQPDRVLVLSELQSVDYVILFDDDTPIELIKAIRPHVLAKGADYSKQQVVGGKFVESYGGEIALIPLVKGRSTSNIINRLTNKS